MAYNPAMGYDPDENQGQGGGLDLDLHPDTYGYDYSQGKWGSGWDMLNDEQRGDLKGRFDSGWKPRGQDEQDLLDQISAENDKPGLLESLNITPEGARAYFKRGFNTKGITRQRKEKGAAYHKKYTRDFTRAGRAAIGAVGGRGAMGSSGAANAAERATSSFAEGHQNIRSTMDDWESTQKRQKINDTVQQALAYANMFGQDADRTMKGLLTELNLSQDERRYMIDLYRDYVNNKEDPYSLDDAINTAVGIGSAAGTMGATL